MTLEEYKTIRNTSKDLVSKVLDFKNNRDDIIYAGKKLGFWDGEKMVLDNDDESDVLMDFLIYEKNKKGKRRIDLFYDSDIELTELEEEILEGQIDYHSSLFEIIGINSSKYELELIDLLDKNSPIFKLMDIGISQTGSKGMIAFTRLIPIRDINLTSGVSFGFAPLAKERVLNDMSAERFKIRRKLNTSEMYILTHKKSKLYGLEIKLLKT